jgi:hypothetical protein
LGLFGTPLDGFSKEDFEVYNQVCWSSNLHNLQRMKTKEKLLTLVKNVGRELGIEGISISSSSEIPSVWNGRQVKEQLVYYSRDVQRQKQLQSVIAREFDLAERIKAGAEHERHLILFARIDAEHFTIGLRFTRYSLIDNRNLTARLENDSDYFDTLLGNASDVLSMDGHAIDRRGVLDAMAKLGVGATNAVELSKSWSREQAVGLAEGIDAVLTSGLLSCQPLFEAALWSETNDHLALSETLEKLSEQVSASVEKKTQEREAKAEAHAERAAKARERTGAKLEAEQAWRKMQNVKRPRPEAIDLIESGSAQGAQRRAVSANRELERSPAKSKVTSRGSSTRTKTVADGRRSPVKKPAAATKKPKPSRQSRAPRKEPKKAWVVGDECTLSRGLFMGKRGQVVALPKAGYVKVKVGVIEVNVSVLELDL